MKNCEVKHYDLRIDGNDSTLFVIIDLADDIIGSCMMFHDGLMQDFHVVEKFRGVGLGSGLLEKVEEIAKEKGVKFINGLVQHKNSAVLFWEKSGFSIHYDTKGRRVVKEMSKLLKFKSTRDQIEMLKESPLNPMHPERQT